MKSFEDLKCEILNLAKYCESASFIFHGWSVEVKTNSSHLLKDLNSYYKEFLSREVGNPNCVIWCFDGSAPEYDLDYVIKQPDAGKESVKEKYVDFPQGRFVYKVKTGVQMLFGNEDHLVFGPLVKNSNQVINFINNRHIEYTLNKGAYLYHAAAVSFKDQGMAICGFSGGGKSTLSLHMMNHGLDFVSNDRLMIDHSSGKAMMYGIAKHPRINPGTIVNNQKLHGILSDDEKEQFQSLSLDELWSLEKKYDGEIDKIYGPGKFKLVSPIQTLVILNWNIKNKDQTKIQKVDLEKRSDLFDAFTKSPGLFYFPSQGMTIPDDKKYLEQLKLINVFEVTEKVDFHLACDYFLKILIK